MSKGGKHKEEGPHIENRRAHFDYHISETVECGMVLHGPEVKSVRSGEVSLAEGFVRAELLKGEPRELWLHGVQIADYAPAGSNRGKPLRIRKLLAKRAEINRLWKASQVKGNTIVPLKIYFKNGYAKCLVGVGTGKKEHDKRDSIRERESKRDIARAMSKRVGPR